MVFLGYRLPAIVYIMNMKNIQASTVCIKIRLFVKLICFERPFINQLSLGSPDVIFSVKIFPMNILLEIDILMVYFWKRINGPPNPIIIGQRWYFYCVIWGNLKSKEYEHQTLTFNMFLIP